MSPSLICQAKKRAGAFRTDPNRLMSTSQQRQNIRRCGFVNVAMMMMPFFVRKNSIGHKNLLPSISHIVPYFLRFCAREEKNDVNFNKEK